MKIKWLGHASFLVTSNNGIKVITDPYEPILGMNYKPIDESADIVTVSHGHGDHNNVAAVQGNPPVIDESTPVEVKGIKFRGIDTYHDDSGGSERGPNIIFCFDVDGVNVCHLGDLGHDLDDETIEKLGPVDILFIPVGGTYTIDADQAWKLVQKIKPRITVPMHYKIEGLSLPITGIDLFLAKDELIQPACQAGSRL